ncbi:MAG: NAD-dependent epimerase/dehydratase family protein [Ginsengibacter sp.]
MKIIIVGATGTMGKHLVNSFQKEHEIFRVATKNEDIQADITSTGSIENMFKQVGPFDALISTAGPTYVDPWNNRIDKNTILMQKVPSH